MDKILLVKLFVLILYAISVSTDNNYEEINHTF